MKWVVLSLVNNAKDRHLGSDPALVGKFVPQVPSHILSVSSVYNAPQHWTVTALLRAASRQFDDDLNQFPLEPYSVAGVSVSRQICTIRVSKRRQRPS